MKSLLLKLFAILCAWVVIFVILGHLKGEILYIQNIIGLQRRSVSNETEIDFGFTNDTAINIPQSAIIIEQKEEKQNVPASCACETKPLFRSNIYEGQLSMPVPVTNQTSLQVLANQHPNFPHSLLVNSTKEFCTLMPPPHNIAWQEIYYQTVTVSDTTTYLLYSAFLDNRPLTDIRPCIRILAFTKAKKPTPPWCYTWFNTTGPPAISQVIRQGYTDYQAKSSERHMFFLLTCRIPADVAHLTPLAVSVVRAPCEKAQTLLQVNGAMERKNSTAFVGGDPSKTVNGIPQWNVAVCGPALFYYHDDISISLVEWLELLRAQGVAKVFLLETSVHPNIEKVLRYYEADGFVGVTKFSYPVPYANEPNVRRLWVLLERSKLFGMENIYFTDCLLRHMHEYRFISHFDPDEMPMLPNHDSFPSWLYDQIRKTKSKKHPSYDLSWYYHHSDLEPAEDKSLPKHLWFLRHTRRTTLDVFPSLRKPTYDMDVVTSVFSHGALTCVYGKCKRRGYQCPRREAYLGHYRRDCGEACKKQKSVLDVPSLLKYKDQVSSAVNKVLVKLELI